MYVWTQIEHPPIMMLSRMTHNKRSIPTKVILYQFAATPMISRRLKQDKAHFTYPELKDSINDGEGIPKESTLTLEFGIP